MKTFKAKLLRDLTYLSTCDLRKGSIVKISQPSGKTTWVVDSLKNQMIRVFNHDYEVI